MKMLLLIVVLQSLNLALPIYSRRTLLASNLALRQQLGVYKRKQKRPALKNRDRVFWALLSRVWPAWRSALIIVQPETVLKWQKKRFRNYWRKKSRPGRPTIDPRHIRFIRRISADHPEYGEDRIALELEIKFGVKHSATTIRKYMVKSPRPRQPSQSWRTLLRNQADAIWMCDFCVQYTVRFTAFYIFVIMELESRKVVHFAVTEHPTLAWVKQQIRNAAFEDQPKFIIHDNDGIFGQFGRPARAVVDGKQVSCRSSFDLWLAETMRIRGIAIPYGAPNAAAHIERFMGTLRREVLDRILIWNERQLRAVLAEYIHDWYNNSRVHQGIHGIPDPDPALAEPRPPGGRLVARSILNGLHHDYRLAA